MNVKYLIVSIAIIITLLACNKEDEKTTTCDVDNPLELLTWLNDIKRAFETDMGPQRQQIIQYQYEGDDVFLIDACYQCPDAQTVVYDCEQNVVCLFGGLVG